MNSEAARVVVAELDEHGVAADGTVVAGPAGHREPLCRRVAHEALVGDLAVGEQDGSLTSSPAGPAESSFYHAIEGGHWLPVCIGNAT